MNNVDRDEQDVQVVSGCEGLGADECNKSLRLDALAIRHPGLDLNSERRSGATSVEDQVNALIVDE
jgi:hypothetical protein